MYQITPKDLDKVKEFSINAFRKLQSPDMPGADLQQFLIIQGLYDFLKSKGIEPGFQVEDLNQKKELDNYESLEEIGS